MRSFGAFVGAAAVVLSYPAALVVGYVFGAGAVTVIHFVMGIGFIIFATSVFGFGLPRWINLIGAAAAGAFGTIFVLQGIADLTHLEGVRFVAFDIFGRHVERLLPLVVYLWFIALLLLSSRGKSRVLGWIVMLIVVGSEIASLASLVFGFSLPNLKVVILLPFVWLLFESAENRRGEAIQAAADRPALAETPRRGRSSRPSE